MATQPQFSEAPALEPRRYHRLGGSAASGNGQPARALQDALFTGTLLGLDGLALATTAAISRLFFTGASLGWACALALFFHLYEGLYTRRLPFMQEAERIVRSTAAALVTSLGLCNIWPAPRGFTAPGVLFYWLNALWALLLLRWAGKRLLARWPFWRRRVLILGAGETGRLILQSLTVEPNLGLEVAGFLDDNPAKQGTELGHSWGTPVQVLGRLDEARALVGPLGVRDIILAVPALAPQAQVELVRTVHPLVDSVQVVPDFFGLPLLGVNLSYFFNERTLVLNVRNNLQSGWSMAAKRVFDVVVGLLLLPPALVIMAVVALAVKLDSAGPVFFADYRLGRGGRDFRCFKFRTMYVNSDAILDEFLAKDAGARAEWERFMKLRSHDPRVTRVGRVLRKWSLDELPQLFNVLRGEMSLVGPRPYLPREAPLLLPHADAILAVRPGITGLWQVLGRNEIEFKERLHLEVWYTRNWSLWLDTVLLLRTVVAVLKRRGAS